MSADKKLVSGHLEEIKGFYHMILNYYDENGNRKRKSKSTKLSVKGNKKRAENMLMQFRQSFETPGMNSDDNILFTDYLLNWLKTMKAKVEETTFSGYSTSVEGVIIPYFQKKKLLLSKVTPKHIQDFYTKKLESVSSSTVKRYHANIHKAFKDAIRLGIIQINPMDRVDAPKNNNYTGSFYSPDEAKRLMKIVEGTKLELPVILGFFCGMRRSEILGLKWSAVDFENNSFVIRHTITTTTANHKRKLIFKDRTKNKSSRRSLPLEPLVKEKLLELKEHQEHYRKLCKSAYNKEYLDYVFVNEVGDIITPDYISRHFKDVLAKNNMRDIRFHDLRHTCASLMLTQNVSMKEIQVWLGHSDFSTTANIYAHIDSSSKISAGHAMSDLFSDCV